MSMLNLAGLALAHATATGQSIIVVDIQNAGSDSRFGQQLPSIDWDEVDASAPFCIVHPNKAKAAAAFEALCLESCENDTGMISGKISLVTPRITSGMPDPVGADILAWDVEDATRPVLRDGAWTDEMIADRV